MELKRFFLSIGLLVMMVPILGSCRMFVDPFPGGSVDLRIGIPPLPGAWGTALPGGVQYLVSVCCRGERFRYEVAEDIGQDFTWCSVPVPAGSTVSITAVPEITYKGGLYRLYPAGAVYPCDCGDSGSVRLSWKDGFLAGMIETLSLESFPLEQLNIGRLRGSIEKRSDDPWTLDRESLLEAVLDGSLTGFSIRKKECFTVKLPLPSGVWVSENTCNEPFPADGGSVVSCTVTAGMKRLFRLTGDPCVASYSVSMNGKLSAFTLEY